MNHRSLFGMAALVVLLSCIAPANVTAQQYKIRQSTSMMGMKSESTVYVKGMRKRTEPGKIMGMQQPTTIEQCDLKRTIKINDKKKLYYIESTQTPMEEVIDDDAPKSKPAPKPVPAGNTKKGGVIEIWNIITDTAARKQMYGLTARHIWTYMKMKPSADACFMKDSMVIKTDGWYVDLPEFNCPPNYSSYNRSQRPGDIQKPDCMDRYVNHRKGKAKTGFALTETRTVIMGGSSMSKMGEMSTTIETLEFSAVNLDSSLFTIPAGYTQTTNEEDLQEKMSMKDMMNEYKKDPGAVQKQISSMIPPKPGAILIGVLPPTGGEGQLEAENLQLRLMGCMSAGNNQGIAVTSAEDAKSKKCTYLVTTEFTKLKQVNKVGGILKAIKNGDVSGGGKFDIEGSMTLTGILDDTFHSSRKINDKFEGKINEAAAKALEKSCNEVLKDIK